MSKRHGGKKHKHWKPTLVDGTRYHELRPDACTQCGQKWSQLRHGLCWQCERIKERAEDKAREEGR